MAEVIRSGYIQWEFAPADGFFQKIDARIKVIFLLLYIIIVSLKREIMPEVLIGGFVFILVLISRLHIVRFYKRVFFLGFFFGFLIALPSALNIITRGNIVFPLFNLSKDHSFWIYHVPGEIGITAEGINVVVMLTLRVLNSVSIAYLVLYTTPFPDIIRALKVLKVPDTFLIVITLAYKYIFIFTRTVEDMYLAKKSRMAGQVNNADARGWVAGRMGFVFNRTRLRCEEIFKAMTGKGFSEDIKLYEAGNLDSRDIATGCVLLMIGGVFLWM